jgi:hypothetical protein
MVELRHLPSHATVDQLLLGERHSVFDLLQAFFDTEPEVLVQDGDADSVGGVLTGRPRRSKAVISARRMRRARSWSDRDV